MMPADVCGPDVRYYTQLAVSSLAVAAAVVIQLPHLLMFTYTEHICRLQHEITKKEDGYVLSGTRRPTMVMIMMISVAYAGGVGRVTPNDLTDEKCFTV